MWASDDRARIVGTARVTRARGQTESRAVVNRSEAPGSPDVEMGSHAEHARAADVQLLIVVGQMHAQHPEGQVRTEGVAELGLRRGYACGRVLRPDIADARREIGLDADAR